jgi:thiosulfate reductase cytochrome b subunit
MLGNAIRAEHGEEMMAHTAQMAAATRGSANAPAKTRRMHPWPLRIMHWTNALVILIMIGSGWRIYNDEPLFGVLFFSETFSLGGDPIKSLQLHGNAGYANAEAWHFLGMWILVLNGLAYVAYGFFTGRFRRMLWPIRPREVLATVRDALHLQLAHDDLTVYNAVQKLLYVGVILIGILTVISGLAIWKPVQFSELVTLFGTFQTARLVHFLCMTAIVGFVIVHVSLALLVPHTLLAMFTGGPAVDDRKPAQLEPTH